MSSWSSWSAWIPLLINSIVSLISIHFLFKLYTNIVKHVDSHTKQSSSGDESITNKETLCERCKSILTSSAAVNRNYHNKNLIKPFDDESSSQQRYSGSDRDVGSPDDDPTVVVGHVSTREVIGYDAQSENGICRTKSTVSMLRKQFENVGDKKSIRNLERQISEKFFKRATSPARSASDDNEVATGEAAPLTNNDYYVIEQTKVYKVLNNNKETVKGTEQSLPVDKFSKKLLSKRSHSNGDIKRIKRSPSHDVIAEEPYVLNERTKSMEQMTEDDVEYRNLGAGNNRRSVRTVDDILRQERFSKCYSEYSISDLLNDLPDDDDSDFASFFNKS